MLPAETNRPCPGAEGPFSRVAVVSARSGVHRYLELAINQERNIKRFVRANTEADRSYASAGAHLLRIHTPGRRLSGCF